MNKDFWNDISPYGVIHRPDSSENFNNPVCLLVFVHGVFGDCRKTWGRMPEWVLANAGVELRVISFSYPSKVWQRCSIVQAADDLNTWLETEFSLHRHILFVTHSTGGLIVKQLICTGFKKDAQAIAQGTMDYSTSDSIWLKTRKVINIAVPHEGGSPFASIGGKYCYALVYPFMAPGLRFVRFVTQGHKDWGKNQIIPALRWKNPRLLELEDGFRRHRIDAADQSTPFPQIYDIGAKADLSVPFAEDSEAGKLYIRGTHKSIKIPQRINAPIVTLVAERVRQYGRDNATNIVDGSMTRIAIVNRTTSIQALIETKYCGIGDDRDSPRPSLPNTSFGSQAEIVKQIVNRVRTGGDQSRQLVVTGAAGVGKSLVTRMVTWELGVQYLRDPGGKTPLPLFIPLQQITVTDSSEDTYSWETLWRWWLNWGKSLYPDMECSETWLEEKFKTSPVAIVLDGVDDFLHNHPMIGFSSLVAMLREATKRYAENPNFSVVVGIRNSIHGLEKLADSPKNIFEVLRLSIAQAKAIYPTCQSWIDVIKDRKLLDFVLTPLMLSNYEPVSADELTSGPITQESLLLQTFRTVLSRSRLVGLKTVKETSIELDHLNLAMTFIAWIFYYKNRGDIHTELLRREALTHRAHWQAFFDDMKTNNEVFFYENLSKDIDDIIVSLSLIEDPALCTALLQRTVFVPTGPNMVRFAHRQWQEFLLGNYLSLCIRTHHFNELGLTAFHSRIYRMAGDSFGSRTIGEGCVHALFDTWKKTGNTYITGNFIAFLTWTQIGIEPQAIRLLLNELASFEPLSRLVLTGGLSYRILVNHDQDLSIGDIKRALLPKLNEFSDPSTSPVNDPVVSSLCWCNQMAFAEILGTEPPSNAWPSIGFDDEQTLKALPMICTVKNGSFTLDNRSKSLQIAFLVPITDIFKDSNLAIRAVHYLYYLVVARKHEVHVMELSLELPQILSRGCQFEKIIKSFQWAPEVFTLYQRCQAMHEQLESAAT